MKKKNFNKKTTGRVIELTREDNRLFKNYLNYRESITQEQINPQQIASDLFSMGLHTVTKDIESIPLTGHINHQQ